MPKKVKAIAETKRSFDELVHNNVIAWLGGILVAGFGSGIACYEFVIKASGQQRYSVAKIEGLTSYKDLFAMAPQVLNLD